MNETPPNRHIEFRTFDPDSEVDQTERKLPHWFQPGIALFVTFRTIDSMPRNIIQRWQSDLREWLRRRSLDQSAAEDLRRLDQLPEIAQREFRRLRDRLWHRSLDECHGECALRQPELARIVGNALLHFDGNRYDLDSFVVMPNHVHLLVQFRPSTTLNKQSESWLRYTARRINEQLARRGAFWQPEPFDHLVRSPEQFSYLQWYIAENPSKAKLVNGEFLYWARPTM